ncbi:MAG: ABC transporter ATP-binding protein [Candidatus Latescibacterota bacterium]|nr:ABC transporter ATP-binding protein [Candidatus Latescibacterota bacterium]
MLEVLNNINMDVSRGELVAVMGASGVGKSTLLHILGALEEPTSGQLKIIGENVFDMSLEEQARFRNQHIGFVFQHHHLLPEFTALENVLLPARIAGKSEDLYDRGMELLETVGLLERVNHRPDQLSGGECQRVAIVRAIVMRPDIVLADEPSGNLDATNSQLLHSLLRTMAEQDRQAFVVMTHDEELAMQMDRCGYIEHGCVHF